LRNHQAVDAATGCELQRVITEDVLSLQTFNSAPWNTKTLDRLWLQLWTTQRHRTKPSIFVTLLVYCCSKISPWKWAHVLQTLWTFVY